MGEGSHSAVYSDESCQTQSKDKVERQKHEGGDAGTAMIDTGKWKTEINQLSSNWRRWASVTQRITFAWQGEKWWRYASERKEVANSLSFCAVLPLFKDHRHVRRGVGCDMQNTASITKVACKMRCQHAKLIDVWMRKMKSGSRQTRLKVRQSQCEQLYIYVKVLAQWPSLSLSPLLIPLALSSLFIYFPLSISFLHWKGHSLTRNTGHRTLK